jgi:SSS family solute:Na+ symporter
MKTGPHRVQKSIVKPDPIATFLINDIVNPLRRTPLDDRTGLRWARAATLLTGTFAVVFALEIRSILDILIYAYNFWAPIILVPLTAALLGLRPPRAAFLAGAAAGIAGVVVWNRLLGAPGGFDGLIVGVFANLIVFALASLVSPARLN